MFTKKHEGSFTALIVYVDDMVITGNDTAEIAKLKKHLQDNFQMKNLGQMRCFLGIEIDRSSARIFLNHTKYAMELLEEAGMANSKSLHTPLDIHEKFTKEGEPMTNPH